MAIKIGMLRCFTMVATYDSLSEAADALGRIPSAVSMMLKQFEEHVGSALFETARKSRLTPIGELILNEARRVVAHFENAVSVFEGLARSECAPRAPLMPVAYLASFKVNLPVAKTMDVHDRYAL